MAEQTQGHGMALWSPPDPAHALECTEGCGYPILLQNEEPLIIPTPIRFDTSQLWLEAEADEWMEGWDDWPSIVAKVDSQYAHWTHGWQPYRIWDVWPITSSEHKALRNFHHALFQGMDMETVEMLAQFEYGDYSVWEEIEARDLIDEDRLGVFEAEGDDDGRERYLEDLAEQFMDEAGSQAAEAMRLHWHQEFVVESLCEQAPALVEPWHRLKQGSASGWRTVARCFPPQDRDRFFTEQRWINPWP